MIVFFLTDTVTIGLEVKICDRTVFGRIQPHKAAEVIIVSTMMSKETMERQAWLLYYNRVLFEKKLLTEGEYRQMLLKIRNSVKG